MLTDETISAISTPPGEGAVAVIRVSGSLASHVLGSVFRGRRPADFPRELCLGRIVSNGEEIDRCLAVYFPAPRSYTGEPMAEIHCHGGILVAARVLEAVLDEGARAAMPGEFTQRAFLNGKLDLTQAEAVMDVIRARTPLALRAAQHQLAGRLGDQFQEMRARLLALVANVEAWIDFPEEDITPETGEKFANDIRDTIARTDSLLSSAESGRILREGVKLVLCGAPNAGKSSLLNKLLGFERAIVNPTPGTTRDTIEEPANLGGIPFLITDTAGLRETEDAVERQGVERARQAIAGADLVVHVIDATLDLPAEIKSGIIAFNKCDLLDKKRPDLPGILVSCVTGEGIAGLVDRIVAEVHRSAPPPNAAAINARHKACLHRARRGLTESLAELEKNSPPEFAATGLHEALDAMGEILGVADAEEILGEIFARFCIGK